jgi:2-phospho-L-lactate guanylyltransferase
MIKALLIPIKDPARAKTRLARLLSADERRRLASAMFNDVCRAVARSTMVDRVALVSSYRPAIERARQLGWDVLVEQEQYSESASVDWASRALTGQGIDSVMRLPADLPLVGGEDIDSLLSVELRAPAALLVPSREGTGTNAIIRTPPDLFPSRFGPGSLALHRREGASAGVECLIVNNDRIAFDIDEPQDLADFIKCGRGTETYDLIAGLGLLSASPCPGDFA